MIPAGGARRIGPASFRGPAACALAALALTLAFAGSARWQAGGPSLPLDDPFIYFQYARQTAHGQVFRYNDGDPPTQGATSPLFVLLLVPGFWLGLDGLELIPYLLALGALGLAASALLARRLAARWLGPPWGGWAAALVLLCGPLVWGCLSGMEIPATAAALLWLLDRADRVLDGGRPRGLVAPAAAVALLRPEGVIAVVLLGLVLHGARRGAPAGGPAAEPQIEPELAFDRPAAPAGAPGPLAGAVAVPLLVALVPGLLFALAGGSFLPAGIAAKSRWAAEPLFVPEALRATLESAIDIAKGIFGGSLGHRTSTRLVAYDMNARGVFFAPFALALFILGAAPAVAGELGGRRPGRATLVAAWLLGGILATASLAEPDAHFNRYQQPLMPLFLLGVVAGVVRIGRWAGRHGAALGRGLAGYLVLFGAASTAVFAVHYGDNASDIRLMQMAMAGILRERLPAEAVVAVNDAGALRYLGERRTVDLVGLTTPGLARLWRMGPGSLIEELERWPTGARPTHFAIFPNWFRLEDAGILRPLQSIELGSVSIVDAEKVLYAADWSAAEAGGAPAAGALPAGFEVVDEVDVADRASEGAHRYRARSWERGLESPTFALARRPAGDSLASGVAGPRVVEDGGRAVTGGERMRVRVHPGREVVVILRTPGACRARVSWDGAPVGEADLAAPGRQWGEAVIARVPAALVTRGAAELAVEAATAAGGRRPVLACHYWIAQPR